MELNYTFTLFVKKRILPEGRYSMILVSEAGRTFVHRVYFRQLKDMYTVFGKYINNIT